MDVTGQGISIPDNDTTPRTADDTEFGDLDILAPPTVHTFTIENAGTADLSLTGAPNRVTISDSVFTVTTQPGASVAPVGTTTFDISFDPAAIGEYTGTVTVANDDADENPYTFDVHGAGTSAPEIDVRGRGQSIADGDLTPSLDDDTAFGSVNVQGGIKTHVFTVHNVGSENLTLTDAPHAVQVDQAEFTVAAQPTSPIPPGGQATFDLTFDPDAATTTTATVSIANNDADEAPYTFRIQGTGLAPPSGGGGPVPSAAPTTAKQAATHVTMTTATLRATVNPNMLGTGVSFEYGAGWSSGAIARTLIAPYTESVAA